MFYKPDFNTGVYSYILTYTFALVDRHCQILRSATSHSQQTRSSFVKMHLLHLHKKVQIFIMFKCCLGFVVAVFCLVGVFLCLFFFFLVGWVWGFFLLSSEWHRKAGFTTYGWQFEFYWEYTFFCQFTLSYLKPNVTLSSTFSSF